MSSQDTSFHIQPHPAKDNNPRADSHEHDAVSGAIHAPPGIQKLDEQTASQLEAPKSDEELQKRSEELNK
ncbi:hypothetical protein MGL_2455 [Malassezia globosa CBS 7966]|uniref:Uncharacterized protein n=1 Tax=Malassezia globosa (strain ATCC MYA-4612 / CBS 7966) TaxID=425265 RepID=A8Q3N3_MALGO|nr:uncharacterized protein MGL_2455 [Malassezia globosa CBS 7966]EDP43445.1 hypothetical protein MGL_2455 [Malassezia globosa CBS 7966]